MVFCYEVRETSGCDSWAQADEKRLWGLTPTTWTQISMSSIVLTLEYLQSLDELVLGTKVLGNYFSEISESFLWIYCLGVLEGHINIKVGTRNKMG